MRKAEVAQHPRAVLQAAAGLLPLPLLLPAAVAASKQGLVLLLLLLRVLLQRQLHGQRQRQGRQGAMCGAAR